MDRLLSKKKYSKQNYLYGNKNSDRHCGVSWEKEVYNIKKKSIMNWSTQKYLQITKHELTLGHSINLNNNK